jgi:hypothetical protein
MVLVARAQERPLPVNLGGTWLRETGPTPAERSRSFWAALALSIRPNFETAAGNAAMKLDSRSVTIEGGFSERERLTAGKFIPNVYAVGITGKAEF